MAAIDIEAVADIIREVAEVEILPRWRNLAAEDISHKAHKGDLVTVADRAAEAALDRRLRDLLPGSTVIGEEAAFIDKGVLDRFSGSDPVWVLDPIDGTRAFAEGGSAFDVLVALVVRGRGVAGWIFAPAENDLYLGEAGSGVVRHAPDGTSQRIEPPARRPLSRLNGIVTPQYFLNRKLPDPRKSLFVFGGYVRHTCAGHNYTRLLSGEADFLINFTTPPWDHIAGITLTQAVGFHAARHDGHAFRPLDPGGGILVAPDAESWRDILDRLVPEGSRAA